MCELVDEAIGAGALGFSTSRTLLHRVPDGRPVPGTWADAEELLAIADVLGRHGRGVFEAAPRLGERDDRRATRPPAAEVDMMAEHHRDERAAACTFGLAHSYRRADLYRHVIELRRTSATPPAPACGRRPRPGASGCCSASPTTRRSTGARSWKRAPRCCSLEERLTVLRDPVSRCSSIEDGRDQPGDEFFSGVYVLDDAHLDYRHDPENTLLAARAGRAASRPVEAFIDLSLESDGRVLLNFPFLNQRLDAVEEMLADPNVRHGSRRRRRPRRPDHGRQPAHVLPHLLGPRTRAAAASRRRSAGSRPTPPSSSASPTAACSRPGAFADVNVIDLDAPARCACPSTCTTSPAAPVATSSGPTATTPRSSTGRCSGRRRPHRRPGRRRPPLVLKLGICARQIDGCRCPVSRRGQ